MHPIALLAALLSAETLALIVLGGVVHTTGASLACPDWPTCGGEFFPEMSGGVLFEHSHRVLASWVALNALTLVVWIRTSRATSVTLRKLGFFLLGLLATQVTLGAVTVLYRLPPFVSGAHLGTAMPIFMTSLWIVHLLSRPPRLATCQRATLAWSSLATVAVFFQILSGAVVRHSGAALVCSGFPLCGPELWPSFDQPLQQLQMLHRAGAFGVVFIVVGLFARLTFEPATRRVELLLATCAATLAVVQPLLGIWSVTSRLGLTSVTLHLAAATLLLGALFVLRLELGSFRPDLTRSKLVRFPAPTRPPGQRAPRGSHGYE